MGARGVRSNFRIEIIIQWNFFKNYSSWKAIVRYSCHLCESILKLCKFKFVQSIMPGVEWDHNGGRNVTLEYLGCLQSHCWATMGLNILKRNIYRKLCFFLIFSKPNLPGNLIHITYISVIFAILWPYI